jgi:Ca2+-transporting ATPase
MSLVPVLFKLPLVLLPAHIAFLELIIDPACSTVFEAQPEDENIMKNKPRNIKESMFNRPTMLISVVNGLSLFAVMAAVYLVALKVYGLGENEARTIAFTTLVFGNLALIMTNVSRTKNMIKIFKDKNKALYVVLMIAIVFLGAALYIPALRNIFHFSIMGPVDLLICFALGAVTALWFEFLKFLSRKNKKA